MITMQVDKLFVKADEKTPSESFLSKYQKHAFIAGIILLVIALLAAIMAIVWIDSSPERSIALYIAAGGQGGAFLVSTPFMLRALAEVCAKKQ